MRKRRTTGGPLAAFALAALLLGTWHVRAALGPALAPGDRAPALRGQTLAGVGLQADWRSHTLTVVNFWATWCEPCRVEMPALQSLLTRHDARAVAVVGVMVDQVSDEVARKFASDLGISYPIIADGIELAARWGGVALVPTTFLVNDQGRIVRRYVGATPETVQALQRDVDAILGGKPLGIPPKPPVPESVQGAPRP